MNSKLLILNLGVDSENTSLAFTQKWINDISLNYDAVDVLTMKVGSTYQLNENVNLFFINDHYFFHQLNVFLDHQKIYS